MAAAVIAAVLLVILVVGATALLFHHGDGDSSPTAAPPAVQTPTAMPTAMPTVIPTGGPLPLPLPTELLPSVAPQPVTPPSASEATDETPAQVTAAYYAALESGKASVAFGLLCTEQQAEGESAYAAEIARNDATGTGIKSWKQQGMVQVVLPQALVPGHLVLSGGTETDIQVFLLKEQGLWKVCSSNLGGVIPPEGGGAVASPSAATV